MAVPTIPSQAMDVSQVSYKTVIGELPPPESNADTLESQNLSIYRKSDIESLAIRLEQAGHRVEPLDFTPGTAVADGYVDLPPYRDEPHLRLLTADFDLSLNAFLFFRIDSRSGN